MRNGRRPSNQEGWILSGDDAQEFRKLARSAMTRLKMTQSDLAERLNVEPRTVSRYFEKRVPLTDAQAGRVMSALADADKAEEIEEINALLRFHSPNMQAAFQAVFEYLSGRTREQQETEDAQFNRHALAGYSGERSRASVATQNVPPVAG